MKSKNLTRIAESVVSARLADKGTKVPIKGVKRMAWLLEKLVVPHGVEQYTMEDFENYLRKTLQQRGHTIVDEPLEDVVYIQDVITVHDKKDDLKDPDE